VAKYQTRCAPDPVRCLGGVVGVVGGGSGGAGATAATAGRYPQKQWTVPRPPKPRSTNVGATAACQTGGTVPPSRGVRRVSHRRRRRRRGRAGGMSAEGPSAALAGDRRPVGRGPRRHGACRHLWHEEGGLTGTRRVAIEDATAKAAASDRQAVHLTRERGSPFHTRRANERPSDAGERLTAAHSQTSSSFHWLSRSSGSRDLVGHCGFGQTIRRANMAKSSKAP